LRQADVALSRLLRSATGFVNVYASENIAVASDSVDTRPKSLKAIGNLTTSISTLRFNHDAQLLAIASNVMKDQMRLVRCLCYLTQLNH
jgi:U3 small nucleolar RNA-associated protein 18